MERRYDTEHKNENKKGNKLLKTLQKFSGKLDRGYVGNITYRLQLEHPYDKLYILLTYDKEKLITFDDGIKTTIRTAYEKHYGRPLGSDEINSVAASMKTEIQLAAFIQNKFVGNVHQPGTNKEMLLSATESSRGCLPCKNICGMLKLVVNVFGVMEHDTSYLLEIKGESSYE